MLSRSLRALPRTSAMSFSSAAAVSGYSFETLAVNQLAEGVIEVALDRPSKLNAMNQRFWAECAECFDQVDADTDVRAVVLTGGDCRLFTAGLDLMDHVDLFSGGTGDRDPARVAFSLRTFVKAYQNSFTAIERCSKPVIAAVHNACIGGGVDMVCAADIRFCSSDAFFSIKEVEIGLAADVGTLQRLPKIVGNESLVRELALTGRRMSSEEADKFGLVSKVLPDKKALMEHAVKTAVTIAGHSPVAVAGTKRNLVYARDHSVEEGLEYAAIWNAAMVQTVDIPTATQASMEKTKPVFSKL